MQKSYDLAVVGGGPGGYVAAIKAAQAGLRVVCIEGRGKLGGTCLNVGCIPSKTLLHSTLRFHEARKAFAPMGINTSHVSADWSKMMASKDKTVEQLTKGIEFLFKKNKVDYLKDWGSVHGRRNVRLASGKEIEASSIIIATGSEVSPLPGVLVEVDEKRVLTSTGALRMTHPPKKLVIVGGGAIGLEFASIFSRLGSTVEVVEFLPQVANGFDKDGATALQKCISKLGVTFHLSHRVVDVKVCDNGVKVTAVSVDGKTISLDGDNLMICVGRRPNTSLLDTSSVHLDRDKLGRIIVDERFQTSEPDIYAIGDVIPGPMLAHKAEEDGVACVKAIVDTKCPEIDHTLIPGVIYTHPELASVGETEASLQRKKKTYSKGIFPFSANSRARCTGETEGFVKVLADDKSGKVLGGSVLGSEAGDMIQLFVLAMKFGARAEDLGDLVHPHPCLVEAFKEANLLARPGGKAIHL